MAIPWGSKEWREQAASSLLNAGVPACKFHPWAAASKHRDGRMMCPTCGEIKQFHGTIGNQVKPIKPPPSFYEKEQWDADQEGL